jgi:crossover junction endodeoxyribonuclease RuvC
MSQSKSSVILALDVSSASTGYAVLRSGRWRNSPSYYGTIKTSPKLSMPERLKVFRDELEKVVLEVKPNVIAIEDVFRGPNVGTMKLLARFNGVAVEFSRRYLSKDPIVAMASEIRSTLESGKSKELTFAFICKKYNLDWKFNEMNDVADAIALALYAHKKGQE